jgi:DNA end-binding protein Ku
MWSGTITFNMVSVPVKMYKATDSNASGLSLVCACHNQPIKMPRRCSVDDHPLQSIDQVHAAIVGKDVVILDESDMDSLPLRTIHAIEIESFVPKDKIPMHTASALYYLEPNDPKKLGSDKPYALLRAAMVDSGTYAVARVGMREREQLCALSVHGDAILLSTLAWPELVRDTSELKLPKETPDKDMLALALQLVDGMRDDWKPDLYRDNYGPALESLIQSKVNNSPMAPVVSAPAPPNIMDALRASLDAAIKNKEKKT